MKTHKATLSTYCGLALAVTLLASGQMMAFGDSYSLDTCPVSGGKLGSMGDPIVKEYEGREIRFCCAGCPPKFEADPAKYLAKVDAAIVAEQKPFYPLDTCVVLGGKLGSMGEPIDHVYQNRLVRFCCKGCVGKFEAAPDKYLSKLDEAIMEKQKADYPLDTCIASDEKLGSMGEPIDYVLANRLLRLCCEECKKRIEKNPSKHLADLAKAASGHKAHTSKDSGSHSGHGDHGSHH